MSRVSDRRHQGPCRTRLPTENQVCSTVRAAEAAPGTDRAGPPIRFDSVVGYWKQPAHQHAKVAGLGLFAGMAGSNHEVMDSGWSHQARPAPMPSPELHPGFRNMRPCPDPNCRRGCGEGRSPTHASVKRLRRAPGDPSQLPESSCPAPHGVRFRARDISPCPVLGRDLQQRLSFSQ